jgi:phage shock protein E
MNNSTFYLLSGIFSLGYTAYAGLRYYSLTGEGLISASKARDMLRTKQITHVIDVRTTIEYRQGHYKKSINIPVTELTKDRLKNINKNSTILIYCNTGQRARRAVEKMREIGYKKVYYIEGTYKGLL